MWAKINEWISWNQLRMLGESRILRSSYFWFIAVPIAAKLLSQIDNPITIESLGERREIQLSLPFSWYLFYFSSTAFAAATFLYSVFCPEIIKKYPSFIAYYQAGNGVQLLREYATTVSLAFEKQGKLFDLEAVVLLALKESRDPDNPNPLPTSKKTVATTLGYLSTIKREALGDIFHVTSMVCGLTKPLWRVPIACLYLVGFVCLFVVICQNFYSVWITIN